MSSSEIWKSSIGMNKTFRGQRRHDWKVIPRLFRVTPNSSGDTDSLVMLIDKISALVWQLQASDQGTADDQGVAIVQHYSEELGVGT